MTRVDRIGAERWFHPTGVAPVLSPAGLYRSLFARTGADTALDIATAPEPPPRSGWIYRAHRRFWLLPKPPAFTKVGQRSAVRRRQAGLRRSPRDAFGTVLGCLPMGRKAAPTASRPAFGRNIPFRSRLWRRLGACR